MTTARDSGLDLARLENVRERADGSKEAACPACRAAGSDKSGDHLLIKPDGRFGCALHPDDHGHRKQIFDLAGRHDSTGRRNGHEQKRLVAAYDYRNATGDLLFQVCRFYPKDFRQRKPDPSALDGWIWNTKGVKKVLFRLPEILRAVQDGKFIIVCEGEQDALALVDHGLAATCNPGGAGKWLDSFSETLRDADVVIIPDRDAPGRAHAQLVAGKLLGVAKSVRVLELPDTNGKPVKDAANFFAAGGDTDQIGELVDAAPTWTPTATPDKAQADTANTFDKITADVRGDIIGILADKNANLTAQRREICERVLSALNRVGKFYFHGELRDFDSTLFFNRFTKRLERIRGDAFTAWLSDWLKINSVDALFRYIAAAVETEALGGQTTTGILPECFWASRPGAIYISSGDGQAIRITPGNVETVDNGADGVLFAAGRTCQPWKITAPRDIFQSCAIFRDAHTTAGHAPDVLRAWVYSLPTNPRCKPPLLFVGEVGAGKTAMAKAIAGFFGLVPSISKVEEITESNFWPCVNDGGIYCLDNADTKTTWLADTIAAAATDGSSKRRKLYCDSETVILRPRAWLILTSSNPSFAADPGFSDRVLVVRMARRDDCDTGDAALADEIAANRDAGLSHLARTLATALADTAPTPPRLNARHPDFAAFAVKLGRALAREPEMVAALKAAESDKSVFCLENDFIGAALLGYLQTAGQFTGTAKELCERLIEADADLDGKLSPKRLGKRLVAIMPHLRHVLQTARDETDRKGFKVFTFKSDGQSQTADFADFQSAFSDKPPRE